MAVHRTKKQSDLEKRFKHLEFQLYGRGDKIAEKSKKVDNPTSTINLQSQSSSPHSPSSNTDVTYLRKDLTKIALFASAAIGVQLLIYFSQAHHLLKLPI